MLNRHPSTWLLVGAALLAPVAMGSAANAAQEYLPSFVMTSTTFEDGGFVPARIANAKAPDNECVGENISPQLSWTGVREGVKSFALTMFEMEDPPHTALVVYGIPANVTSFAEGELSKPSDKFVGGRNYRNMATWRGMCPPSHEGPYKTATHHYEFILRGTDLDPKALPPGLTADELDAKLMGHVKGRALLVARFKRPE